MGTLSGQVAIVTGAASAKGIGFATAKVFVAKGAQVVLTDVMAEEVEARAAELGSNALGLKHDVTSESDWERVVTQTVRKFGRLSILVNNAGVARLGPIARFSREDWDAQMAINLTSQFLGCRAAVSALREARPAAIVNISSVAGIIGAANVSGYAASKAGVRLLTKSLALELADDDIRVNSVHPGVIDTAMQDVGRKLVPEVLRAQVASIPLKRMGEPEDIGNMVAFLASDEARYITGAEFVVDGGLTAQ